MGVSPVSDPRYTRLTLQWQEDSNNSLLDPIIMRVRTRASVSRPARSQRCSPLFSQLFVVLEKNRNLRSFLHFRELPHNLSATLAPCGGQTVKSKTTIIHVEQLAYTHISRVLSPRFHFQTHFRETVLSVGQL